ncbi:uncharacterized protein FA14DRAFT_179986 [Meira miltonrushii]|uniref:Uncharacterized protein n=1 Tax=Meira miltonrushii TaxID=1280837 RepID=A0A316VAV2_9BASI|nr:uncharacterized protein FA14DRAFT_179986 [Meira miltonrushii]PWN33333.1 hypothetical protein FA14DRAFT_179986 [Meira miltonrushii]
MSSDSFWVLARYLFKRADTTDTFSQVPSETQNPDYAMTFPSSRGLNIDLNHSPPTSPTDVQVQPNTQKQPKRKGRKPKYTPEERIRVNKERLQKKNKMYTRASVNHAKKTMKGEQLRDYLQRAQSFRIQKRIRDTKSREKLAQRYLKGTQTSQDDKGRLLAIERAKEYRKRKSNDMESLSAHHTDK